MTIEHANQTARWFHLLRNGSVSVDELQAYADSCGALARATYAQAVEALLPWDADGDRAAALTYERDRRDALAALDQYAKHQPTTELPQTGVDEIGD